MSTNDFDQTDPPQDDPLEELLTTSTGGCKMCASYQEMLRLVMDENTELNAKIMEAELGRKMAEEMLPKNIQKFLLDQAEAASRIAKAKELAEAEAALANIAGLAPPPAINKPVQTTPFPPNTITGRSEGWLMPFGKYRGLPLAQVPTDYIAWCLAQTWLRPEPQRHMRAVIAKRQGRTP